MGEQKSSNNNRWNWEVSGFEPRRSSLSSPEELPRAIVAPLMRRYSISAAASSIVSPYSSEFSKQALASKVLRLKDKLKLAKEDYLELRQDVSDLQEYSNAKLDRVTRYLGVLAEKTRKLDQFALESEARISPLVNEKKRLFNDLLTAKGNIKLFCRTRPLFEDEASSIVEFPDECTIRINTGDDTIGNPKKDFEFDIVYGPHVGQAELFSDVQPFVQSALNGYNVSIFAYGQTRSGKTHTMIRDLLSESGSTLPKIRLKLPESSVEFVQDKVDNPMDFSKVLKSAFQSRQSDTSKINVSHLIITVHIYYNNLISGENSYSVLSLIDLAGSDGQILEEDNGERVTDLLHVMKSLSALGDVLSSFTSNKDDIPYENSMLTNILADSLGILLLLMM